MHTISHKDRHSGIKTTAGHGTLKQAKSFTSIADTGMLSHGGGASSKPPSNNNRTLEANASSSTKNSHH